MAGYDGQLVVHRRRPARTVLLSAGLVLAAAAGGWWLFDYGRVRAVSDYRSVVAERDRLESKLAQSRGLVAELRAKNARLESARQIGEHAQAEVREAIVQLQQENQDLREELQFYRNIVAPSEAGSGVQIQRLRVEPDPGGRVHRFTLTLIRIQGVNERPSRARGEIELAVEGSGRGGHRRLSAAEVLGEDSEELRYSIRYFKKFEGELRFPEGFEPERVIARVVPRGDQKGGVEKVIQWPAIAGRGG